MSQAGYRRLTRYARLSALQVLLGLAAVAGGSAALGAWVALGIWLALGVVTLALAVVAWGHYHADVTLNPELDDTARTLWRIAIWCVPGSMALYWHRHVRARGGPD